ncbi:MAG: hypothetical protein WAV54_03300 [Acidimicrobiales bacterium]
MLVASREADDLVGEDRADDERDIVFDHGAVDPHLGGVVQPPIGQLGDPVGRDGAERCERQGVPPPVIEDGCRQVVVG